MNKTPLIVIVIVAVVAAILITRKHEAPREKADEVLAGLQVGKSPETQESKTSSADVSQTAPVAAKPSPAAVMQDEFKKCFNKETQASNLEAMKTTLSQLKDFSSPSTSQETYELVTPDNKNLIVQHIPMEEDKNKVRVFSISQTDQLPDRIKDFPNSKGDVSLRMKGALSLGTQKSVTKSTTQTSYDGSLLSIDHTDDKVSRIHLMTNNFDFECKDQSCHCLKKE